MVRSYGGFAAIAFSAAAAVGCRDESEPTYYEDVAPILSENCAGCHRAGGIAPFVLTDYESARSRAGSIADATREREMPPMPVDNSGACNQYSNARWLSNREIETLGKWADAGAPEGDSDAPRKAAHVEPELENPDVVIGLPEAYTPSSPTNGKDDYRCFVVPAPVDTQQFLTSFQVYPGDARVVHHVIVYQPVSAAAVAEAHAFDDAEEGEGYTCFGSPLVDASPFALWAPGVKRMDMPERTGVPLAANRELVIQIHYNLDNGTFPDQTTVGLKFATEPVIPGIYLSVANTDMMLAPGQPLVESSSTDQYEEPLHFKVHGAMPHMHTLGRTLHAEAEAAGQTRCLVDVDRWDFHWQNAWWYETPLELDAVRSLSIRCGFDTRSRTDIVTWGDSTSDEMCISYFYATFQDEPTPPISCTDSENPLFGSCLQPLLDGCYEPDVSGICSVSEEGTLTWSDGSKLVQQGQPGLYGPDDESPCVTIVPGEGSARLERGDDWAELSQTPDEFTLRCSDGSNVVASRFHFGEFAVCSGLSCAQ